MSGQEEIYSGIGEIAARLRKSERSVKALLKDGGMGLNKLGGTWTATESQLVRLIETGSTDPIDPGLSDVLDKFGVPRIGEDGRALTLAERVRVAKEGL